MLSLKQNKKTFKTNKKKPQNHSLLPLKAYQIPWYFE